MRNRIRLKLLFISFILPPQDLIYITFTLLSYLLYRVLTVLTLVSPLGCRISFCRFWRFNKEFYTFKRLLIGNSIIKSTVATSIPPLFWLKILLNLLLNLPSLPGHS